MCPRSSWMQLSSSRGLTSSSYIVSQLRDLPITTWLLPGYNQGPEKTAAGEKKTDEEQVRVEENTAEEELVAYLKAQDAAAVMRRRGQATEEEEHQLAGQEEDEEEVTCSRQDKEEAAVAKKNVSAFKDSLLLGIDFGTGECCIATFSRLKSEPEVVPAELGDKTTPSWVTFTEFNQSNGDAAKKISVLNPKRSLSRLKRLLAAKLFDEDVQDLRKLVSYAMRNGPTDPKTMQQQLIVTIATENTANVQTSKFKTLSYSASEAASLILTYLRELACNYTAELPKAAVVGVPCHFTDAQREALEVAVSLSGMQVIELIEEPIAAAIAHGLDRFKGNKSVLVCDLGQHGFRASILAISGASIVVDRHVNDISCGGEQIDELLVGYCAREFARQHPKLRLDLLKDSRFFVPIHRLRLAVEAAKRVLSVSPQTTIELPDFLDVTFDEENMNFYDATFVELRMHLTRGLLEQLCEDMFKSMQTHVKTLLNAKGLDSLDIYKVLVIGGGANIPKVRALLQKDVLDGAELTWNEPFKPEEAVARGAAIRAAVAVGQMTAVGHETTIEDSAPLSLGIEIEGGIFKKVIERGTPVPCHRGFTFSVAAESQSSVVVQVFEGERHLTRDNQLLARFLLDGIAPCRPGDNNVRVAFTIDLHNDLNVTATDLLSGMTTGVKIPAAQRRRGLQTIQRAIKAADGYREFDENEQLKVIARNNLQSDCLYFGRILKEEVEAGRIGDVAGKSELEKTIVDITEWVRFNQNADVETYDRQLEALKDAAAPVMQHMSQKFAKRAGAAPEILD